MNRAEPHAAPEARDIQQGIKRICNILVLEECIQALPPDALRTGIPPHLSDEILSVSYCRILR
jgi:hypothetical protein